MLTDHSRDLYEEIKRTAAVFQRVVDGTDPTPEPEDRPEEVEADQDDETDESADAAGEQMQAEAARAANGSPSAQAGCPVKQGGSNGNEPSETVQAEPSVSSKKDVARSIDDTGDNDMPDAPLMSSKIDQKSSTGAAQLIKREEHEAQLPEQQVKTRAPTQQDQIMDPDEDKENQPQGAAKYSSWSFDKLEAPDAVRPSNADHKDLLMSDASDDENLEPGNKVAAAARTATDVDDEPFWSD